MVHPLRSAGSGPSTTDRSRWGPIPTTSTKGPVLARRQSPQTFEKRRRERDKKLKKADKQQARVWRNAEKRDEKMQREDPAAWALELERRREIEARYYYYD